MTDWGRDEAIAECRDLRQRRDELEAENARLRAALIEISQLSGSHFSKTIALGALAAPYGGTDKVVRTEFTEALVIEQRAR